MSEDPQPPAGRSRSARIGRALLVVVVAVAVLWLLFTQVFPRVERYLEDPTLGVAVPVVTPAGHG